MIVTSQINEYPQLMISTNTGMVVLMTKPEHGVVLAVGSNTHKKVGYAGKCFDMDVFKPYTGTFEMRNV